MDGYIKNKKAEISDLRRVMFWKYACTLAILVFIPVWLLGLAVIQPPEKWLHDEIVFSNMSEDAVGLRRGLSNVINTIGGRKYVVDARYVRLDGLVPGNTYSIVYSRTVAGGDHIEALYDANDVIMDLELSAARRDRERSQLVWALIVNIMLEVGALALIHRLWCAKERAQIAVLKANVARRAQANLSKSMNRS